MELSKFKKLLKDKYDIDIKQIFINTEKKTENECTWSEIAWKDCPILVKESGFKSSKPIIKFIARKNFYQTWDRTIYVTAMSFIIPISAGHVPYMIKEYAIGNISKMPVDQWRAGPAPHYGKSLSDLTNVNDFKDALVNSVEYWDTIFKKILNCVFVWNKIINDPEIKERREKALQIKKQIKELNKQKLILNNESYSKYINDDMKDYSENLIDQGLKRIDIKIAGNTRYLAAKKAKNQIIANNLNLPS